MSSIGRRMSQVRTVTGLNQLDFAAQMGVATSSYKNYERSALDPPISLLVSMCEKFGVDANWLILGKTKPNEEVLQKVSASIAFAVNFLEEREIPMSAENLNLAVATLLNVLEKEDANMAPALPLLNTIFAAVTR